MTPAPWSCVQHHRHATDSGPSGRLPLHQYAGCTSARQIALQRRRWPLLGAVEDRADPDDAAGVPDDGFPIRAGDHLPDIAIDPSNGATYVVWADGVGTALNKTVMVKATDGGRHRTRPTIVSNGGPGAQSS